MAFRTNPSQQLSLEDRFQLASKREQRFVLKSWAKGFSEIVFPAINEERFAVLYSQEPASRPNTPINVLVGALMLKELFQMTDEELVETLVCGDLRFQYALHTTSFVEQPLSKNSFNRFRKRLYLHYLENGEDLLHQEMEALAEQFCQFLGIQPTMKRMDSLMIAANCRRLSRLELMYTCVQNLVKTLYQEDNALVPESMRHYLKDTDANQVFYHDKDSTIDAKLDRVIQEAHALETKLDTEHQALPDCQLLHQVLDEQTTVNEAGQHQAKAGKEITPESIQNPAEPEATYRNKAGKHHFGYVANLVETVDENGTMITNYDYDVNTHSDVKFCEEWLDKIGTAESEITLVADGSYNSTANREQAEKQHIQFAPTNLNGTAPAEIKANFQINEDDTIVCPAGHQAFKTSHYEKPEGYCAWFDKETCESCSLFETCQPKMQKKASIVKLSKNQISRARYLKQISSQEFKPLVDFRNGIEGVPSVLRRRYHVDKMPVRGLVRTKLRFSLKIGAINIKNLLKGIKQRKKNQQPREKSLKPRIFIKNIVYQWFHPRMVVS